MDKHTIDEVRNRIEYIYENYKGSDKVGVFIGLDLVEDQLDEMEEDGRSFKNMLILSVKSTILCLAGIGFGVIIHSL